MRMEMPVNLIKMENKDSIKLSLTIIMVPDPKTNGYTAYFEHLPNIVTEGNTKREAISNLFNAVHDVINFQNDYNLKLDEKIQHI